MTLTRCTMSFVRLYSTLRLIRLIFAIIVLLLMILFITYQYVIQLLPNSLQSNQPITLTSAAHIDSDLDSSSIHPDHPDHADLPVHHHPALSLTDHAIYTFRDLQKTADTHSLHKRAQNLMQIRSSVIGELRLLETKRNQLQNELQNLQKRLDDYKNQLSHKQSQLNHVQSQLEAAEYAQKDAALKNKPFIAIPLKPLSIQFYNLNLSQSTQDNHLVNWPNDRQHHSWTVNASLPVQSLNTNGLCSMINCFDYSKCSLIRSFKFHVSLHMINHHNRSSFNHNHDHNHINDHQWLTKYNQIINIMINMPEYTSDVGKACLFVIPVVDLNQLPIIFQSQHWNRGQNHLLINLIDKQIDLREFMLDHHLPLIAQTFNQRNTFRYEYDLIVGFNHEWFESKWSTLINWPVPNYSPAKRTLLFTCIYINDHVNNHVPIEPFNSNSNSNSNANVNANHIIPEHIKRIQSILNQIHNQTTDGNERVHIDFNSTATYSDDPHAIWNSDAYLRLVSQSTFVIILPPNDLNCWFNHRLSMQLQSIVRMRSIPVLIGYEHIKLPFDEVIDWSLAAIRLPFARVSELHLILKALPDATLISLRRHAQFIWQRYLASTNQTIATTMAVIRQKRLQMPAMAAPSASFKHMYGKPSANDLNGADVNYIDIANSNNNNNPTVSIQLFEPLDTFGVLEQQTTEQTEQLGPIESPQASVSYQHNWSSPFVHGYSMWNSLHSSPFRTYPYTPFDDQLTSDAEFVGSTYGYRPIGDGWGGSGKQFSERLGGNQPTEQFTIVMLTYEREQLLMESLRKLRNLPYLNKIIVIWNAIHRLPAPDIRWPQTGVPLVILRSDQNSLNNRFLPLDEIETEAILSMDDDAHLRHDEIVFGFRVWRESRDRIVGFPGRFHAWSNEHNRWFYNSNYSCELSMVLTGAAFIHKYYFYLYSFEMPQQIRDKVDEYMNCEDIAMNFLVSHVTRKPPLKVTSRWTFRCTSCTSSLSEEESHFIERHNCINYFTQIYGYNPLLYTQFRADSVLFKTRVPHNKQKCFKLI